MHCKAQVSLAVVADLAQQNSTAVRIAEADVSRAQAVYSERKNVVIPSLGFSTGVPVFPGIGFTGTPPSIWSATVNSLVFSIPQMRFIDAARLELQMATTNLKVAREQAALDASSAYIELDTVTQELSAAKQEEGFAIRLEEIEQERVDAGVDPARDLLQAKLTVAEVKLKRLHLQTRAAKLTNHLDALTGLPAGSILPDHASIPGIPEIRSGYHADMPASVESLRLLARSKLQIQKGDEEISYIPQLSFGLQYNRNTEILNSANDYFVNPEGGTGLPVNNVSSRIGVTVPIFDLRQRAKARESAAEALRATVDAEEAQGQNDLTIVRLTSSLREFAARAEIASLQQEIAQQNLKSAMTQLELGNGGSGLSAVPQLSPKDEQVARIHEKATYEDALEAYSDLAKARLSLLGTLGHLEDWLHEPGQH